MLVEEATSRFFDEYLKRGSKAYRREKFSRLSEFLNWVETEKKVKGLGQIGTKHVFPTSVGMNRTMGSFILSR